MRLTPIARLSTTACFEADGNDPICFGERMIVEALSEVIVMRFGISLRIVEFKTVPNIAKPNDPPSERKNITVAVATPRSANSTAF